MNAFWQLLRHTGDGGLFPSTRTEPKRMTVHTQTTSFTGEIEMHEKGGRAIVGVTDDEGSEYVIPYGSVEYFEEPTDE